MAWGRRKSQRQDPDASGWIARDEIVRGSGSAAGGFDRRLNAM